jgi:hypothetical protein
MAPSVKPALPAAGIAVVCVGGLLTAGLPASALAAALLELSGASGLVDFNAFDGTFCDAFRVALAAFFVALFAGFLADSLALAGRVPALRGFVVFTDCLREAAFRAAGFGDALEDFFGDFLRVFLDIRLPFVAFGGSIIDVAGLIPEGRNQAGCWASLMASEYGYKELDVPPVRSLTAPLGPDGE